jgi:hypothetical protein
MAWVWGVVRAVAVGCLRRGYLDKCERGKNLKGGGDAALAGPAFT